ncbi:ATP-binding protein [Weeksellaceae bacterium A-14]
MDSAIPRPKYLKRIEPFIGKNLIKVFTGQRRVGKSYLLFQIIEEIKKKDSEAKIIYINKEDLAFAHLRNADDLNGYVLQNKSADGTTYVLIDEIQDIENFEVALRSLLLDKNLDLYCTGSNANLLSSDIAGHLSGRYIEIPVYSLSYTEFLDFHQLKDSDDVLEKYLKFGGLPYLIHLPLEEAVVFEYLENVYSTILFRDIINRFSVRNTVFLEQLILFLASNTGSLFSAKKISDFLKSQKINMAPNQVQTYIQHLTNAFLIHRVNRYDIVGKRLFEIGEKYYFENLGIRNALWGFRAEDRGKILENAVYNHLLTENYKVQVGIIADSEIDFIAEKNGEKMYIQATLTLNEEKTIEREFGNLLKIKDNYPKLLITMDRFSGNTFEGVKVTDLRTFLMGN